MTTVGLGQDVLEKQRWRFTAYSHPNETYRTEAWDSIDIDRTIVAVDHEEAVALGLPSTAKFPWDHTKDIYALSVFHQLHCMASLIPQFSSASDLRTLISWVRNLSTDRWRKRTMERASRMTIRISSIV